MKKQDNIQLSKRLKMVTQMVSQGNRVADIGCDHGYISIYIVQNKIATKVIAMDVNKGPLKKAEGNVEKYSLSQRIETRLSDGGKELRVGEVDTVIIAGMGGALMSRILEESRQVISSCKELVLQPQSKTHLVRRKVRNMGFQIIHEEMLIEEGKYYIGIKALELTNSKVDLRYNEVDDRYGRNLLEKKDPVLKKYLIGEYKKKENIIKELGNSPYEKGKLRMGEILTDIEYIKKGLKYYEM